MIPRLAIVTIAALHLLLTGLAPLSASPPPAEQQIAAAILAAPEGRRDEATVLGFSANGELGVLRAGSNDLVCLADTPDDDKFSVACYHGSLEPYMARGRELRNEGVTGMARNEKRWQEAKEGKLALTEQPAMLYVLSGSGYDAERGEVTESYLRWVIYVPYATGESTGLSTERMPGAPWLMAAGTAGAHIMISPPRN